MRMRAVGCLLVLLWGCAPVPEPGEPGSAAGGSVAASRPDTPLRTVVVHWKIKPGREKEFLDYWSERATVANRAGLVAEFLSGVEDRQLYPWINWRSLDPRWTSYFNIGLWRDGAAFQDQVGRFIDNARPPLDFEADRRERVLVAPQRWRIGGSALPAADAPGVR